MNIQSFTFLLFLIYLLSSCSSGKIISTTSVENFNINNYQSFDFYQTELNIDEMPEFEKRVDWIKEAIEEKFKEYGLEKDSSSPELLVNIGIVLEEKIQTRETDLRSDPPTYIGQRRYHWEVEEVEVGRYNEGAFTLDLVNAKSQKLLWQGVAEGIVSTNDKQAYKNLKEGTQKLLSDLDQ
ncbi:DUF4136 domain-containing protein [Echinicola marina]|uniref:DUF4136 domain-containing protein n=1 Tax=Echinicola marina TaxID=2859768 RepID=UPI001CF63C1F|nr:DUF4136 domain-containing protein [Echinicola marina]UCS92655.1 DUF4136 domain-containing protein [Echinicola marina]